MGRSSWLSLVLLASTAGAAPVDNCASLLGSLSVELRFARTLPAATRTTFTCPRDTSALVGASKQRILDSLGTPDATGNADGSGPAASWSYFFTGAPAGQRGAGVPELAFSFDALQQVSAVDCHSTR